jgi:hypothetical protein
MTKKDDTQKPKKVLAMGAKGDPEHPELGGPSAAKQFFGDPAGQAPISETPTQAKKKDLAHEEEDK